MTGYRYHSVYNYEDITDKSYTTVGPATTPYGVSYHIYDSLNIRIYHHKSESCHPTDDPSPSKQTKSQQKARTPATYVIFHSTSTSRRLLCPFHLRQAHMNRGFRNQHQHHEKLFPATCGFKVLRHLLGACATNTASTIGASRLRAP